jgi:hypothetical protein
MPATDTVETSNYRNCTDIHARERHPRGRKPAVIETCVSGKVTTIVDGTASRLESTTRT